MKKLVSAGVIAAALFLSSGAVAAEKTVTLAVERMSCATCPYIVKHALAGVPGVKHVEVSYENGTAVVTFDDTGTTVAALAAATTSAGFLSSIIE